MRISDWSSDVCSSDLGAAVTFLRSILSNVLVAAGKEKPKDDELPTAVADLEKQIKEHTSDLTAILPVGGVSANPKEGRSEEHTSELQSLMRISYAVFCLKKKNHSQSHNHLTRTTT